MACRYAWSDLSGAINGGNATSLKHDGTWDWCGDWVLKITKDTDSEGWIYAHHFSQLLTQREGGRTHKQDLDFVRSRKYVRKRMLINNIGVSTHENKLDFAAVKADLNNLYDHRISIISEHVHKIFKKVR